MTVTVVFQFSFVVSITDAWCSTWQPCTLYRSYHWPSEHLHCDSILLSWKPSSKFDFIIIIIIVICNPRLACLIPEAPAPNHGPWVPTSSLIWHEPSEPWAVPRKVIFGARTSSSSSSSLSSSSLSSSSSSPLPSPSSSSLSSST